MATPSLAPGHEIAGRYRVIAHLGSGGMGDVYEVEHALLRKRFAIKRLAVHGERDQAMVERFLREARAAAATGHPGVVDVVDLGFAEDGMPFLVMERLHGETLRHRLDRGPLDEPTLLRVAHDVLDALGAVHDASIIHRDIKPENLFLCRDGRLKILDFGLSHDPGVDVRLTQSGAVMGTPLYMAPEQARGEEIDARTDLYALGAVLYEAATARPPFAAPAYSVLVALILESQPDPEPLARLSAPLREAILAALAKRPADRPASAAAMAAAMPAAPDGEASWAGPAPPGPARAAVSAPTVPSAPAAPREPPPRERPTSPEAAAREAPTRRARPARRPPADARRGRVIAALAVAAAAAVVAAIALAWPRARRGGEPPVAIEVTSSRRLTLDPGCEENPLFTPDGATIVFDAVVDGDYELFAMPADGGPRRRLTHAPGWDYAAALSPDGTRLAYIHEDAEGRTLRLVGIDGDRAAPPVDLGPISGYPAWTRDGALLVGDGSGQVLRRDLAPPPGAAIARETVLGRLPPGARPYHLVEVAGGGIAILWWTSSEFDATALGELDPGGALRVIEETATDYEGGLAASPTRRGYYVTRKGATTGNQLWWRPWGGGAPALVPGGLSPGAGIDVARDGRRLVLSTCRERPYVARLAPGGAPVALGRGEWIDQAAAAIDERRVLVTSDRGGPMQGWVIELDTGAARPVTPPGGHAASPSRDGRAAVFVADGGRGGLAWIDLAAGPGAAPRALTADPSDAAPAFTAGDRHVVFTRSAPGSPSRLHAVPAEGGPPRALAAGAQPGPSPVADVIAYVGPPDAAGAAQLLLIELGGGLPRPVPGVGPAAWSRPRFSPDGARLVAVRGYREVVVIPLDGGGPEVVWTASTESAIAADWMPDGAELVLTLGDYVGDLWLAEGTFP